jgi:hypothetical protein
MTHEFRERMDRFGWQPVLFDYDGGGSVYKRTLKYSSNLDGIVLNKIQYSKVETQFEKPEDYVFFVNDNSFVRNTTAGGNPYAFSIEKIDDVGLQYFNLGNMGAGYKESEMRKQGVHKISFRQTIRYTENGKTLSTCAKIT